MPRTSNANGRPQVGAPVLVDGSGRPLGGGAGMAWAEPSSAPVPAAPAPAEPEGAGDGLGPTRRALVWVVLGAVGLALTVLVLQARRVLFDDTFFLFQQDGDSAGPSVYTRVAAFTELTSADRPMVMVAVGLLAVAWLLGTDAGARSLRRSAAALAVASAVLSAGLTALYAYPVLGAPPPDAVRFFGDDNLVQLGGALTTLVGVTALAALLAWLLLHPRAPAPVQATDGEREPDTAVPTAAGPPAGPEVVAAPAGVAVPGAGPPPVPTSRPTYAPPRPPRPVAAAPAPSAPAGPSPYARPAAPVPGGRVDPAGDGADPHARFRRPG